MDFRQQTSGLNLFTSYSGRELKNAQVLIVIEKHLRFLDKVFRFSTRKYEYSLRRSLGYAGRL